MKYLLLLIITIFALGCGSGGGGSTSGSSTPNSTTNSQEITYTALIDEGSMYSVYQYSEDLSSNKYLFSVDSGTLTVTNTESVGYVQNSNFSIYHISTDQVVSDSSGRSFSGSIVGTMSNDYYDYYVATCETSYLCLIYINKETGEVGSNVLVSSSYTIVANSEDYFCFINDTDYPNRVQCEIVSGNKKETEDRYYTAANLSSPTIGSVFYNDSDNNTVYLNVVTSTDGEELYKFEVDLDSQSVQEDVVKVFDSLSGAQGSDFYQVMYADSDRIVWVGRNDADTSTTYIRVYNVNTDTVVDITDVDTFANIVANNSSCIMLAASISSSGLEATRINADGLTYSTTNETSGSSASNPVTLGNGGNNIAQALTIEGIETIRVSSDCGNSYTEVTEIDAPTTEAAGVIGEYFAYKTDYFRTDGLVLIDTNGNVTDTQISNFVSLGTLSVGI